MWQLHVTLFDNIFIRFPLFLAIVVLRKNADINVNTYAKILFNPI